MAMAKAGLPPPGQQENGQTRELQQTCMSNLLASAEERVYFKDRMSRFLYVSAAWAAACAPGQAPGELVGKTDFDVFSAQHASAAFADEQRIMQSGEPIVAQIELETYSGRPDAWVSTTKMPLRDDQGQIIGTFGISRDVTAQIQAERTLAQQALELSRQNERLRELDALKDEFIALVSHELRTPLTSIIGYVKLLRDDRADGMDTEHFAEVIERNAERLLRLVGDLLFLSQVQAGELAVELHEADLADIAAQAVQEARPQADRKKLELVLTAATVRCAAVDPLRIGQLLGNLLSNAVKFTPPGGHIEVRVDRDERRDEAVLMVSDTGLGIPSADLDRIFERFFRTAGATERVIPGTGLGLTISKAIVEAHGGQIAVNSDEGRGATFTVRLPCGGPPGPPPGADAGA
jgi:PAS domain S-box-containing protein